MDQFILKYLLLFSHWTNENNFIYIYMGKQMISVQKKDRTQSGVTTPSQSGPGSEGNEGVLHIPQSSSITGASPLDLVSYLGHSW